MPMSLYAWWNITSARLTIKAFLINSHTMRDTSSEIQQSYTEHTRKLL